MDPEEAKAFKQWSDLPHHVVNDRFRWAFSEGGPFGGRGGPGGHRRPLDYDDLVQEGNIALVRAWRMYNPDKPGAASFKTYAYKSIYRAVKKFIDTNGSSLGPKKWRGPDGVKGVGCMLESEVAAWGSGRGPGGDGGARGDFSFEFVDAAADGFVWSVDRRDWIEFCLARLRSSLTNMEYRVLVERAAGRTNNQIARTLRYTRENVRKLVNRATIKAAVALCDQEEYI